MILIQLMKELYLRQNLNLCEQEQLKWSILNFLRSGGIKRASVGAFTLLFW